MFDNAALPRRARRALGPWLLVALAGWFLLDNGPALVTEWRLAGEAQVGTGTVLSISGGRPRRAVRRWADDLFWGGGRRVSYRFPDSGGAREGEAAFVTHYAADSLEAGRPVPVRYLPSDPLVHRIEGEPGFLLLGFRFLLGLGLAILGIGSLWTRRGDTQPASEAAQPSP